MKKLKRIVIDHAKESLEERNISISELMDCLNNPDQKVSGHRGRLVYQKKLPLNGRKMLLRVIVEENNDSFVVVTVYKTSKFDKYWKEEEAI